jgi:uncharacterized protein (DUF2252 family)
MKRFALVLALLALLPASRAMAGSRCCSDFPCLSGVCDGPTHFARRHDTNAARLAITTRDGEAVLLLTDQVVAIQLTDKTLHRVGHELRDGCDDIDNAVGHAIKTAVVGVIRDVLDHCAECPIRDLRDVDYRDGKLVFTTQDGQHVFADFDVHDRNVMTEFNPDDAREFVRDFRRMKGRES